MSEEICLQDRWHTEDGPSDRFRFIVMRPAGSRAMVRAKVDMSLTAVCCISDIVSAVCAEVERVGAPERWTANRMIPFNVTGRAIH